MLAGTKRQISINWRKADFKTLKIKPLQKVGQSILISFISKGLVAFSTKFVVVIKGKQQPS